MPENVAEPADTGQAVSELSSLEGILPASSPLQQYVSWATNAYGSPPLFHLAAALTVMTYELGRRGFYLQSPVDDARAPLTLWFALVSASGTGKSTAINVAQDFARAAWSNANVAISPDPWVEPEGSIQGVFVALQDHYDQSRETTTAILFHHELAQVFATREAVSEQLCKFADSRTIQANYRQHQKRKKGAPNADRVVNPRLSLIAATTEAQLAPHFKDAQRSGGIFTRFIWLRPILRREHIKMRTEHFVEPRTGERKRHAEVRKDVLHSWSGWFMTLAQMSVECGFDFAFTDEASELLERELFEPFARRYRHTDDNMHGVCMRLVDKARVIAAVSASMRGSLDIEARDVAPAIELANIFLREAISVAGFGASEVYRHGLRVETLVHDAGEEGIFRRDLYNHMKISKRELDLVLETLADKGSVFIDYHDATRPGRLVHISTDAGQRLDAQHAQKSRVEAELREVARQIDEN